MNSASAVRILLVDDNTAIHEDFRKTLMVKKGSSALKQMENSLFGDIHSIQSIEMDEEGSDIVIDSAYQGQEALELVKNSISLGRPYNLAFVDIRMPPGWDGIHTINKIWEVDSNIQIVICSAYSDYSLDDINSQLLDTDNLLVLKKPFDLIEIRQLTVSLAAKWRISRQMQSVIDDLENRINELTRSLVSTKAELEDARERIKKMATD